MLKRGLLSIVLGIIIMAFGVWATGSSGPFSYLGYSSGTRTIMEWAPWIFAILGAFGILAGIFYIITGMKPTSTKSAKVIEKNGNVILFELEDGSRKSLTSLKNLGLIVGDSGIVHYKGNIIVEFQKKEPKEFS